MHYQSEHINELATALSKAQGEIEGAHKDSKNPFFKSSYADLASVWDACRDPLSKNNLSVAQTTRPLDAFGVCLVTTLLHSSGQWISGIYPLKPKVDDPQGMGSAMTYARRYCLAAMVGVFQTDDDANLASGKDKPPLHPLENYEQEERRQISKTLAKNLPKAKVGEHEHAWKPSKYTGDFGEEMEYCITCKIKRPVQKLNEPELPF